MATSTTAIIRIKRRIEENPLDTLILNCKRFKYDENIVQDTSTNADDDTNSSKTDSTLFKFVGTLDKAVNPLKYLKENRKINIKQQENEEEKLNKIIDKIKTEQKDLSKQNRLKIINCHRALNNFDDNDDEFIKKLEESVSPLSTVIVDVESELATSKPEKEQNNNEFVYDIYYSTNNKQFNHNNFSFDLLHSIEPLDDIIFNDDKYRNNEDDDDELLMSDDSDSNDENNWRNDYPDDEEFDNMIDNGVDQNDNDDDVEFLNNIMKSKFKISNDRNQDTCELSSTDDDEYYDSDTALKYGKRYAQFKAREKENDFDVSDNTDDDDDIYGSDRDQYYNDEDDDNDE
ncbi:protein PFC0760c [Chrysoperla carnea]|uniref:protein PFC0760c n=1 Tax=Chrysoperla carnea TaxID=189513 RepID=UPI001D06DB01|nr:protein PFC0760c [Chrysoperla carnea]